MPDTPLPGRPWAWRPEFFGYNSGESAALLARGFHLVYLDLQNHYGCPTAMDHADALHRYVVEQFQFSAKVAIIAISRGGLSAFNYAVKFPERVACIYADNAVADFKSWPAGWGTSEGSPDDWVRCLAVYGLTEETARSYAGNPVDTVDQIAASKIPVFQVMGDADEAVPLVENGYRIRDVLRAAGSPYAEIIKPGCGHHPHGLEDPTPVVEFIVKSVGT